MLRIEKVKILRHFLKLKIPSQVCGNGISRFSRKKILQTFVAIFWGRFTQLVFHCPKQKTINKAKILRLRLMWCFLCKKYISWDFKQPILLDGFYGQAWRGKKRNSSPRLSEFIVTQSDHTLIWTSASPQKNFQDYLKMRKALKRYFSFHKHTSLISSLRLVLNGKPYIKPAVRLFINGKQEEEEFGYSVSR